MRIHSEHLKSVQEVANWPLAHAIVAVDSERSVAQACKRGEKPRRGTGISYPQIGMAGRNATAIASYIVHLPNFVAQNRNPEPVQGAVHVSRIIGEKGAFDPRIAIRERCQY